MYTWFNFLNAHFGHFIMNFYETVQRALEIYSTQTTKDLLAACIQANDEAGNQWNVQGVRTAAYKSLYN